MKAKKRERTKSQDRKGRGKENGYRETANKKKQQLKALLDKIPAGMSPDPHMEKELLDKALVGVRLRGASVVRKSWHKGALHVPMRRRNLRTLARYLLRRNPCIAIEWLAQLHVVLPILEHRSYLISNTVEAYLNHETAVGAVFTSLLERNPDFSSSSGSENESLSE